MRKLLDSLKADGVRAPKMIQINNVAYLEMETPLQEKVAWVFFKYIKLKSCYSANKLEEAAEQVGKLHASLKKHYSTTEFAIRANANQIDGRPGPALTEQKWKQYITNINNKV